MGVTHKVPGTQPGDVRPEAVESFDLADHPVPSGREEEWRFTPLRRLRGLHDGGAVADGAAEGKVVVEVDAAPEVTVETVERNDPRLGATGTPVDRVAAQAWQAFERATVVTVPAGRRRVPADSRDPCAATGADGAAFGHLLVDAGAQSEAVVVVDHVGSATYADTIEVVVGDGASLTLVSLQEWADDTRPRVGAPAAGRPRRAAQARGDLARRRPRPGAPAGRLRRARRGRRAARPVLRRRRPAPRAPAVRRPRGAALPQQRRLQGRAAGRGRAHDLDRRRADPRPARSAPTRTRSTATWC